MGQILKVIVIVLVLIAGWYGAWRWMMSDDVARVRASIDYHNTAIKALDRNIILKADEVSASGFPFHFQVKVKRWTLSAIHTPRTFGVSLPEVTLEPTDSGQGRYRVLLPATFDALYTEDGGVLENYKVTMSSVPQVAVRAQADSNQCSPLPGQAHCKDVAVDAPIITYATEIPATITLHMELNGEAKDAAFQLTPVSIPVFMNIPADVGGSLELFVGVLREALVYHTR